MGLKKALGCLWHPRAFSLFKPAVFDMIGKQVAGVKPLAERVDDGEAVGRVMRCVGIDDDVICGVIVDAEAHRLPVVAVINEIIGI